MLMPLPRTLPQDLAFRPCTVESHLDAFTEPDPFLLRDRRQDGEHGLLEDAD